MLLMGVGAYFAPFLAIVKKKRPSKAPMKGKGTRKHFVLSWALFCNGRKIFRPSSGLRPDDSRNFKSAHLPKSAHESTFLIWVPCIWWALLSFCGRFEHPWAPMDVHSAHTMYNPTENGRQKRPQNAKFWRTFNRRQISRHLI